MKKFTLSLLGLLIFCSSCIKAKSLNPVPQPSPSASTGWHVKLTQTGGISSVNLTVEVSSDGRLIAENQHSQQIATRVLSAQTVAELKGLIFNSTLSTGQVPQSVCADCFIYDLEILSGGNNANIHVDDVTINDSSAQLLIKTLISLRDESLRPGP
jgi:hypothetical protein